MKKHFLIYCFILLTAGRIFAAESYSVLNVIGVIKVKTTGAVLKKGDVISSEAQVVFTTADAKAAVFSPSKGRFTLSAAGNASSGSEFVAYVKNVLIPNTNTLATRAGGTILNRVDFQNKFGKGKFLMLPGTSVAIAQDAFSLDDQHFFFLRYDHKGTAINKKLVYANGRLSLDPATILTVDGSPVLPSETKEFQFFLYNGETKTSEMIASFDPVFTPAADLKESASMIVKLMKDNDAAADKIKAEVKSYFIEYYGDPDSDTFDAWMKSEFSL